MIAELQLESSATSSQNRAAAPCRPIDFNFAVQLLERFTAEPPNQRPSDWVSEFIVFDDPEVKGQFDFTSREYLRQPIDDNNNPNVAKQTMVFGTGLGKTISYIAGVCYKIVHKQPRGLWVMPSTNGAAGVRNFNKTRLQTTFAASPVLQRLLPVGALRFAVNSLHVRMNGAVIDFAGSNSPGQLASNRCGDIRLDEVDKFKQKLGNEAGASYIAATRADGVIGAQIFDASTPTIDTGPIWQSLLASNLCRRFIPCPHCNRGDAETRRQTILASASPRFRGEDLKGFFVIRWNDQFSILPNKMEGGLELPLADIVWDKEAKRVDGSWDADRVVRSARAQCPHCGGHVMDSDMTWCDQHGLWLSTLNSQLSNTHWGYHLPSMYAPRRGFESTFGGMAKKFLDCLESSEGMRGFINSVLAEPDVTQEHGRSRVEINTQHRSTDDWCPLMTVDVQKNWPYLWFIVRRWSAFKLHPPFTITDGMPDFIGYLDQNPKLKKQCEQLVENSQLSTLNSQLNPAWLVIAELLRFDPRTGEFPLLEWLIQQNITGPKLVALFRERCAGNTLDLGRFLYREMGMRMPKGGDSEAIAAGHCQTDDWAELREVAQQFHVGKGLPIPNLAVSIDSGFREKSNPEVLRKCFQTAKQFVYYDPVAKKFYAKPIHAHCKICPIDNWQPFKGYPITRRWNVGGVAREWHHAAADPFDGSSEADQCVIQVLEAASDLYWERMDDLRKRQRPDDLKRGANLWTVSSNIALFPANKFKLGDYELHMNARFKDRDGNICDRGSGGGGKRRWPDHLNDCERNQIPLATSLGFFDYGDKK